MDETLLTLYEEASNAWTGVPLEQAAFARLLQPLMTQAGVSAAELHVSDLYLTFAVAECCQGQAPGMPKKPRPAEQALEERFISKVPLFIRGISSDEQVADLTMQELRLKLLLGSPPGILKYHGRGSLEGWLRRVARNIAKDLLSAQGRTPPRDPDEEVAAQPGAHELDEIAHVLWKTHGEALQESLTEAFGMLSPKDRLLLRFHYVEGKTQAWIARHCAMLIFESESVTQPAVAYRISKASQRLQAHTRRSLEARLDQVFTSFTSVAGALLRHVDLHLSELLPREEGIGPPG